MNIKKIIFGGVITSLILCIGILPAHSATNFSLSPDLEVGTTNPFVLKLQKILNSNGYIINSIIGQPGSIGYESDYFGIMTQKALYAFQSAYNITPTSGYFGSKTKSKINELVQTGVLKDIPVEVAGKGVLSQSSGTPTLVVGQAQQLNVRYNPFDVAIRADLPPATLRKSDTEFYVWTGNSDFTFEKHIGNINDPFATTVWSDPGRMTYNGHIPRVGQYRYRPWLGNIYKHTDGTLIGLVHIETSDIFNPIPDYRVGYKFRQGIAVSTDNGDNWKYLGDVIKPQKDEYSNLGGTPLLIVGDYLYQYYNELPLVPADGFHTRIPAVARAPISEVVAAAKNGQVSSWKKYNNGSWTQDGLTGVGSQILPFLDPYDMHTDAVFSTALGKYLLLGWEQSGYNFQTGLKSQSNKGLYLYTSTNGVDWNKDANYHIYTPSLANEENPYPFFAGGLTAQGTIDDLNAIGGNLFYIYFPDRINTKFFRIPITITNGNVVTSYNLTTSTSGTGTGNISGNAGSYSQGSSATITATPTNNSTFTSWSGCTSSSGNTCTVVMSSNKTVTATFTAPVVDNTNFVLNTSTVGSGTGNITGNAGSYSQGTTVTLTANPTNNSTLTSWTGCTSSSGNTCTVVMSSNKTVTATFTAQVVITLTPPSITSPSYNPSTNSVNNPLILPSTTKSVRIEWENKNSNYLVRYNTNGKNEVDINTHTDEYYNLDVLPGNSYHFWVHTGTLGDYSKTHSDLFISVAPTQTTSTDSNTPTDSDSDGVTGSSDKCPNTKSGIQVNAVGCPIPTAGTFDSKPSDLLSSTKDLSNVTDFYLAKTGIGRIDWGSQALDLQKTTGSFKEPINLDTAVIIKKDSTTNNLPVVSVNPDAAPNLNKPARITVEGFTFAKAPKIKRNGVICDATTNPICTFVSYTNGTLVFDVSGFSEYSFEEDTSTTPPPTTTPSTPSSGGSSGGSSSGGGGGGGGGSSSSSFKALCSVSDTTVAPGSTVSFNTTILNAITPYTYTWTGTAMKLAGFDKTKEDQLITFPTKGTYTLKLQATGKTGKRVYGLCRSVNVDTKHNLITSSYPSQTTFKPSTTSSTGTSSFLRDLTLGSRGEDVRALQKYLNSKGFNIATSGDGSLGKETDYFGPATRLALIRFQTSKGIVPAVGYFGALTRGVAR